MSGFAFAESYGRRENPCDPPVDLTESDVQLASPVGSVQDREGNVWVADTGGNRLLVIDRAFETLLATVDGVSGERFDLPFRLAHHPTDRSLYLSDIGNGVVRRLHYGDEDGRPVVTGAETLDRPAGPFHPNGVAAHAYPDGVRLFVSDEFYHEGEDIRSRIVVFDDAGAVVDSFRTVRRETADDDAEGVPLYWPQGLATDEAGRLYVANAGYGILHSDVGGPVKYATVVRCHRDGTAAPFLGRGSPTLGDVALPRDVAVVGVGTDGPPAAGYVFIPDAATGRVHVFTGAGITQGTLPTVADHDPSPYARREEALPVDKAPEAAGWRFRSPVTVTPISGWSVDDGHGDDPTVSALVSEALVGTVSVYALDIDRRAVERLASVGTARESPDRLDFPAGSALGSGDGGTGSNTPSAAATAWVTDARSGGLQTAPFDGRLAPVDLPANRFPFDLTRWERDDGVLWFVSDYSVDYRKTRDRGQVHVYRGEAHGDAPDDDTLTHVTSFGSWGLGHGKVKLPRGIAIDPLGDGRARVYVADSGNGRIGVWTYDSGDDAVAFDRDIGAFGHYTGGFWNPSDVTVGRNGVYVADENNNRIQRYADGDWTAYGGAGYDLASDDLLMPVSVDAHDGHLFVVDLVTRAIKVFAEPPADSEREALEFVDAVQSLGGHAAAGSFWVPYMVAAGDADADGAVDLLVPDGALHVAQRYTWRP